MFGNMNLVANASVGRRSRYRGDIDLEPMRPAPSAFRAAAFQESGYKLVGTHNEESMLRLPHAS
jgi:hypothetical protein